MRLQLDALLDLSTEQFMELVHARARRRFQRGLKKRPMALIKKLRKAKKEAPTGEKPAVVKTHLRYAHPEATQKKRTCLAETLLQKHDCGPRDDWIANWYLQRQGLQQRRNQGKALGYRTVDSHANPGTFPA